MITDEAKASIETQLRTAEERLREVDPTYGPIMASGAAQEGATLLNNVERIADSIQAEDPAYYSYLFNECQRIWAEFLSRTNLSGLGDVGRAYLRGC